MTIALIAHGGAGNIRPGGEERAVEGMHAAVEVGRAILLAGGSALDAVCATVVALEDNPVYNAGTGAVLNFDGFVRDGRLRDGKPRARAWARSPRCSA